MDGVTVELQANIELPQDVAEANEPGPQAAVCSQRILFSTGTISPPRTSSSRPTARSPMRCTAGRSRSGRSTSGPTRAINGADGAAQPGARPSRDPLLPRERSVLTQLLAILRASRPRKDTPAHPMLAHAHRSTRLSGAGRLAKEMLDTTRSLRPALPIGGMIEVAGRRVVLSKYFIRKLDFSRSGPTT